MEGNCHDVRTPNVNSLGAQNKKEEPEEMRTHDEGLIGF